VNFRSDIIQEKRINTKLLQPPLGMSMPDGSQAWAQLLPMLFSFYPRGKLYEPTPLTTIG